MHVEPATLSTAPLAPAPREETTRKALQRARPGRGPWLQTVSQVLQLAGPRAEFLHHRERAWSSATFAGARHTIALKFTGAEAICAGEDFIEALPEHEFVIPGHLVADATLRGIDHLNGDEAQMTLEVEILLLEDI